MASVEDVLINPQLAGRAPRPPDHAAEARALAGLVAELANRPHRVLQKLTDTIVELCVADSAGVSIIDGETAHPYFRWPAVSGAWADKAGGAMPIDASPCSVVIARKTPLLLEQPERFFPAAAQDPRIHEVLLVPFSIGGEVVGTLWAIAHSTNRKFDTEDARLLGRLADFASAAYQLITALATAEAGRRELEARVTERTRALTESEARLSAAFDVLPVGVGITNADGVLMRANAELKRFLPTGLIPSHDQARRVRWRVVDADGVAVDPANWPSARALRGEQALPGVEMRYADDDGHAAWTKVAAAPTRNKDGAIIGAAVVVHDVTAFKTADLALRASEERLRQFGENSPDVLWILDIAGERIEYLSPAYETIWGESRQLVMDDLGCWRSHLHPADQARVAEGILRLFAGERHSIEYRIFRPDGEQRWIFDTGFAITDETGQVVRVAGVAQDVTARREAEDRVRDSELRFRVLSEGMPQLVWRSHDEGMWTWASPQWCDFTGQTLNESLGRGWLDAIHPDDRERALFAWGRAETLGELDVEYRVHRAADDAWLWHQTRSLPVCDDEGRTLEWLGTSTDVEDLHRLREHERLLLGELQHRVRNSLAVVRSIARRTADASGTVDEFAAHLDGRLSAFARAQAVVTRDPTRGIDLRELIDDELAAVAVRQGHHIQVNGPAVRLQAKAGETLALAFHELATNAVKYGALANGHRLSIDWRIDDEPGKPCLIIDWREHLHDREIAPPAHRGFGMDLLEQTLEYELDADVVLAFRASGLTCTIRVPLASVGTRSAVVA